MINIPFTTELRLDLINLFQYIFEDQSLGQFSSLVRHLNQGYWCKDCDDFSTFCSCNACDCCAYDYCIKEYDQIHTLGEINNINYIINLMGKIFSKENILSMM